MEPEVRNEAEQILARGWFPDSQTLGPGGWSYLYQREITQWMHYQLIIRTEDGRDQSAFGLTAKNDAIAVRAFHERFKLQDVNYEISHTWVSTTIVESHEHPYHEPVFSFDYPLIEVLEWDLPDMVEMTLSDQLREATWTAFREQNMELYEAKIDCEVERVPISVVKVNDQLCFRVSIYLLDTE